MSTVISLPFAIIQYLKEELQRGAHSEADLESLQGTYDSIDHLATFRTYLMDGFNMELNVLTFFINDESLLDFIFLTCSGYRLYSSCLQYRLRSMSFPVRMSAKTSRYIFICKDIGKS